MRNPFSLEARIKRKQERVAVIKARLKAFDDRKRELAERGLILTEGWDWLFDNAELADLYVDINYLKVRQYDKEKRKAQHG